VGVTRLVQEAVALPDSSSIHVPSASSRDAQAVMTSRNASLTVQRNRRWRSNRARRREVRKPSIGITPRHSGENQRISPSTDIGK